MVAKNEAIVIRKGTGIRGWVSVEIDARPGYSIARLLGVTSDGALVSLVSADRIIETCRDQFELDQNRNVSSLSWEASRNYLLGFLK